MICPYNRKRQETVLQWHEVMDDDGNKTLEQKDIISFVMMECPQEGCAVWVEGRCRYAAVSLDNE